MQEILLLRSALHGDAYALEQFSKFDKAMSRLGYKNIQSAMVIREVQEDCQRYDIPIDLAITKPKAPPRNLFYFKLRLCHTWGT